jgi:hypothetical protein
MDMELKQAGIHIVESDPEYSDRTAPELMVDIIKAAGDNNIEEIYLATGDEYLCPVVRYVLAQGKNITVAAPASAAGYIPVCSHFRFLEVIGGRKCSGPFADLEEIRNCIWDIVTEGKAKGLTVSAENLSRELLRRYHEFDIANYGYSYFETFVEEVMDGIYTEMENGSLVLRKTDDRNTVEQFIYTYLAARENKIEDMDELLKALEEEFKGFNIKNYGYGTDIGFILSFPKLEIYNNKGVKLRQTFKLK